MPEPLPRRAAVAVLLSFQGEPEVLLMKRVDREGDPWSGQISLPGGRYEAEDRDLLATAIRETEEEVGIDLARSASHAGPLEPFVARARGKVLPMDISPHVFLAETRPVAVPGEEADDAF